MPTSMSTPLLLTPADCAQRLRAAGRLAVLTGAGLSTAAGIPDFRGPRGLYATGRYDPETIFDIAAFDRDPAPFHRFSRDFLSLLENIRPTLTHRFLADWEKTGRAVTVITQNIDGLHQRAGSGRVLPIHGGYESAHCRRCAAAFTGAELLVLMVAGVPRCPGCGGFVKPDVVFFGENVPLLEPAVRAVQDSDVLLVLGSSLAVYPAAGLPGAAGGDVLIVNKGPVGGVAAARPGGEVLRADADLDTFFRGVMELLF